MDNLQEILNALSHCDFENLSQNKWKEEVVPAFSEHYYKSFYVDNGISKGVLIFPNFNFVIKIPFLGEWEYDGFEEEEQFFQFYGAEENWDYCKLEEVNYNMAEIEGVAECLAQTKRVAFVNDYPIYMQEYVHLYDYGESSCHKKEDEDTVVNICSSKNYSCFHREWLADVFCYYGEKIFYRLLNWLDSYCINDLHEGNIGYIKGRPVLIDYSGWDH